MATRTEIEDAIDELNEAAYACGEDVSTGFPYPRQSFVDRRRDARARLLALLAPEPSYREIEHARNMVNSHAWTLVDALRSRANEQDKRLFDALHDALIEQGKLEVAAARAARQTGGANG